MTKDDFIKLQEGYRVSNVGLMAFLQGIGMSFAQYNYWLCRYYGDVADDAVVMKCDKGCDGVTLFDYMRGTAARYRQCGQMRTGETYLSTLNSLMRYRNGVDVPLAEVDCNLVEGYKGHLKGMGLLPNTVSFYLKHLRAAYYRAVDDELVADRRPFRRVTTSIERTAKRAVSLTVIKRLKLIDCNEHPSRLFARDMFMFSFYTRGMSFVDIAYLQKKNLRNNVLQYRRRKTNQQLCIHWEPCMERILEAYRADVSSPYLFSIIGMGHHDHRRQYQNTLLRINRHLKEIGRVLGLQQPLTMYCARHSWASIARQEGIPVSVISEGMGHDSERTTRIYLSSLRSEVIDNANKKILNLVHC